jgi:scyllo-inositol 2-dehydrogenase (NADP+)
MAERVVNVGIVGLGRSGWDIHARTLAKLGSMYRVCAVADASAERTGEAVAELGCRSYGDLTSLLGDREVELVIIATPSHLHATQTIEALDRGKHVVCEKPMAITTADADRMIAAAERAERLLTVFHNMRYWEDFQKVRAVIASGVLGRIVQIKLTMHRFTRRWDWQTLREFGGGHLFNGGAHLVDLGLQLFGEHEPAIFCDLQRTLTSGDAEDHVKIVLKADGAPTIEVEVSNACAYPQDAWQVMGTCGGLRGSHDELHWKWVDFASMPQRPADHTPAARDRKFNREELIWQEKSWRKGTEENPDYAQFHIELYESLRRGAPLRITPRSVRRTLSVLEKCEKS